MIVAMIFYLGVGLLGFIGALVAYKIVGFANTNVRNRELHKQNEDFLEHNLLLEKKIDILIAHMEEITNRNKPRI